MRSINDPLIGTFTFGVDLVEKGVAWFGDDTKF